MRRTSGLTVLALIAVGCADAVPAITTTTGPQDSPVRLLALGDSYTIGESVEVAERWPVQLATALEAYGRDVEVQIVARTGWTTAELDAGIDAANPQGPFDLVTLLIGVNNQFRGLAIDEYRAEFAALLQRAIQFADGAVDRVIVVSIPDWGATPFGAQYDREQIAAQIDEFNEVARLETVRVGATWVDITEVSRRGTPGLEADDQLHPSAMQYSLWADLILPLALGALDR